MHDGSPYEVSFGAAKVEQKTVQIRENYDIGGGYSSYQNKAVTLVTIRPDTNVTVSSSISDGVPVEVGEVDGNNKYTQMVLGAAQYIHNGIGKQSFEWDLTPDFIRLGDYLICEDATAYTNGGFTDVKAGAYYEDSVKWAVDKKITSGTSTMTFSPDSTCTVAQILTFLWRANGSPIVEDGIWPYQFECTEYYFNAVIWAHSKGLIKFENIVLPETPCTRRMVVTYLWKLAGSPSSNWPDEYTSQTISGTDSEGNSLVVKFSAASLEETTVTKKISDGTGKQHNETMKVTLIKAKHGSTVTVEGSGSSDDPYFPYILGNPYVIENDGTYRDMMAPYNSVIDGGTYSIDSAFGDSGATALELVSSSKLYSNLKDGNGNPYILIMGSAPSTGFTDVPSSTAYAQAVAWAVSQGITAGTSDTTFSPNAICTRGQIVTFLYRAMGK